MVCTSIFLVKILIINRFTVHLMYIKYPWCLVLYTLFLPPIIATAYMACEQHLHGSRTTLVRLASDTCTAQTTYRHRKTGTNKSMENILINHYTLCDFL